MGQQSPVVWHGGMLALTQHTLVIEGLFGSNAAKAQWDFSVLCNRERREGDAEQQQAMNILIYNPSEMCYLPAPPSAPQLPLSEPGIFWCNSEVLIQTRLGGHGAVWRSSDGCFLKSLIQVLAELLTLLAICQGFGHAVTLLCWPGMDSLGQSYKSSLHPSDSRSESFSWGSNTGHSLLSLVCDAQSRGQSWFPGTNSHHAQVIHLIIKILLVFRTPLPAAERAVSQRACAHCFEVIHLPVLVPFSL